MMSLHNLAIAYGTLSTFLTMWFLSRLVTRRNREAKNELLREHVRRAYGEQPSLEFEEPKDRLG